MYSILGMSLQQWGEVMGSYTDLARIHGEGNVA